MSHKKAQAILRAMEEDKIAQQEAWSVESLGAIQFDCGAKKQEDGIPGFRPWTEKHLEVRQGGLLCYRKGGGGKPEAFHLVGEYELHPSDKKCKDCSIEARPVHKGKTKTKDSKKDTKPPPAEQVAYYLFETSAKRDDCLSAFHACQECLEEAGLKEQSPPKTSAKKSALKASNKEAAGARSSSDKVGTVTGQAAVKERPSSPERTMVVAMTRAAAEELSDDEEWCLEDEEDDEDEDKDKISDGARAAAGAGRRDGETRGDPTSSDLYKVLGVERDAGEREIKRAYRREALRHHPDKNPDDKDGAEVRFKAVSEAYETLADPAKRAAYDDKGKGGQACKDPSDIFRDFFGDDDIEEIFSRYDPVWARRMGRYRDKGKYRGNIAQFRPNRHGEGWQVGQAIPGRTTGESRPAVDTHRNISTRRVAGGVERIVEEHLEVGGRQIKRTTTTFIDGRGTSESPEVEVVDLGPAPDSSAQGHGAVQVRRRGDAPSGGRGSR